VGRIDGSARHRSAVLDVQPVFYVIGALLTVLSVALLAPLAVDLAVDNPDWQVFAVSSALSLFFGVLLMLTSRTGRISLDLRQTFVLTTAAWVVVCLFSALPFMMSETKLDAADAIFESMSGLTTTGSTVITGLATLPPGLLLWRSLLQWLGGIGIVGMGIVILPFLRVGGMQLFRSESSDKSDKVVPRAADLALAFGWIYLALTALCTICLYAAGMNMFDSVCHAMTAVSTGGFSTQDSSVGYWDSPLIEMILVVFMIAGGLPFVRYISLMRGDVRPLWRDSQIRTFLAVIAGSTAGLVGWTQLTSDIDALTALRHALFNIVSVITTTGFASTDYTVWGTGAVALFFVLTVLGGCTGSTSGGIKMYRFQILWLALAHQLARLISPHRIMPLTYQGKPVDAELIVSVTIFVFSFVGLMLVGTLVLGAVGVDFVTALSGVAQALANVGPGIGPVIGPAGNFTTLSDPAKLLLAFAMLLGRLELFTVLVLLTPVFWRR